MIIYHVWDSFDGHPRYFSRREDAEENLSDRLDHLSPEDSAELTKLDIGEPTREDIVMILEKQIPNIQRVEVLIEKSGKFVRKN